ncbi:hypothetical protein ACFWP5_05140 [Streptomyces sp. NPDC058469]|uniref:hypothetical protein n=1 Tax=Streptomyces sp. NPDC058469 TaxID=3346514 RepID=UPI0036490DB5
MLVAPTSRLRHRMRGLVTTPAVAATGLGVVANPAIAHATDSDSTSNSGPGYTTGHGDADDQIPIQQSQRLHSALKLPRGELAPALAGA